MTGRSHDAPEPATGADLRTGPGPGSAAGGAASVVLLAVRDGPLWVTRENGEGVLVCGRTLKRLHRSAQAALALRDGNGDGVPAELRLQPQSADLDLLAAARESYRDALRAAVRGLRTTGASWTDIAVACSVSAAQARAVYGEAVQP